MDRRTFLILGATLASGTTSAQAQDLVAQDSVDAIIEALVGDGYTSFEVNRTLLGRVRIVARSGDTLREVVTNPRTGEVLRDVARPDRGMQLRDTSAAGDRAGGTDFQLGDGKPGGGRTMNDGPSGPVGVKPDRQPPKGPPPAGPPPNGPRPNRPGPGDPKSGKPPKPTRPK